jgi:ribosomal protein L27
MTKPKKEVLNYLENNNFITTKQAKYLGVKRHTLSNMVKSGEIIRSKRGVYSTKDTLLDDFYLIQVNNKNVIFSHVFCKKKFQSIAAKNTDCCRLTNII